MKRKLSNESLFSLKKTKIDNLCKVLFFDVEITFNKHWVPQSTVHPINSLSALFAVVDLNLMKIVHLKPFLLKLSNVSCKNVLPVVVNGSCFTDKQNIDIDVMYYKEERDMLSSWCMILNELQPSVMLNYNSSNFLLNYIKEREYVFGLNDYLQHVNATNQIQIVDIVDLVKIKYPQINYPASKQYVFEMLIGMDDIDCNNDCDNDCDNDCINLMMAKNMFSTLYLYMFLQK